MLTSATVRWVIGLLVIAGLALRLAFALLPLSAHLVLLEDDAWMVTAIARNMALGHGPSADGVRLTTGFQPLYPLTLGALPFLFAPDALDAGFTANLLICALLGTLAAWPLWQLASHLGGVPAGLIALTLYLLNPALVRLTVNGMETALGLLLLLTLFAAFYHLDLTRPRPVLLLALLTALAVLARLDAALAFVAIGATLGLRALEDSRQQTADSRQETGDSRQQTAIYNLGSRVLGLGSRSYRQLLLALLYTVATLLLLTPYFAFNLLVGGSLAPSSGRALAFMQSYAGSFNLTNGLSAFYQQSALFLDWLPALWLKLLVLVGFGFLLLRGLRGQLTRALPLLLYLPVPPLYYGYLLQQQRERYFVGLSAVLIVLLAWLAAIAWRRWPGRGTMLALAGGIAMALALNSYEAVHYYQTMGQSRELTQPTSYQAALWLRENLPAGSLIGAKNSGIYQYYAGHTVLNIDGKLNHDIVPVMEQRQLLDYLRGQGVGYLVDREQTMADHVMFYSWEFGNAPMHRTPNLLQRVSIYGKIVLGRFGVNAPLDLDQRDSFVSTRPFTDAAEVIRRFPRPNEASNPVVVYRLKPVGRLGVP